MRHMINSGSRRSAAISCKGISRRVCAAFRMIAAATLCVLGLGSVAAADTLYFEEQVFTGGAGVRARGMGGAQAALADDASAVFHNPAGLGMLDVAMFSLAYHRAASSAGGYSGSFALPSSYAGVLGFGLPWFQVEDRRYPNMITHDTRYQLNLSYGYRLPIEPLGIISAFGATAKLARQEIEADTGWGLATDLGFKCRIREQFTLSLIHI